MVINKTNPTSLDWWLRSSEGCNQSQQRYLVPPTPSPLPHHSLPCERAEMFPSQRLFLLVTPSECPPPPWLCPSFSLTLNSPSGNTPRPWCSPAPILSNPLQRRPYECLTGGQWENWGHLYLDSRHFPVRKEIGSFENLVLKVGMKKDSSCQMLWEVYCAIKCKAFFISFFLCLSFWSQFPHVLKRQIFWFLPEPVSSLSLSINSKHISFHSLFLSPRSYE